jgi:3-(3-hydroxy-phenyl)propionate hydroxylase
LVRHAPEVETNLNSTLTKTATQAENSKETSVNKHTEEFDVIVVGYGPTGLVLASLLGQRGHRVAVVERWPQLYGKPRLTHIDGETARLISLSADGNHALREAWTTPHYYWTNGKGQLLIDVAAGNTRKMLWDDHLSVHQPHIEEAIHDRVATLDNVQLLRGYVATAVEQDAQRVRLACEPWGRAQSDGQPTQALRTLSARFLVGADGSKSFVRGAVGIDRHDYGFNERWLCVDTEPLRPLPTKFDENAVQICDPRRGYMFMPIGKKRQRFEFALHKSETTEEMSTPEAAYRLLKQYHGIGREDVGLIRHLVYTFECRLAKSWRAGRVFLAGDAAHTNPPYLGQGACSGMRDAANLAWKFDLVLRGLASDGLLDTYEPERRPHAQKLMLDARSLGLVANTSNPVKAAVRDLLFKLKLTPKPQFPVLTDGVLARGADGKPVGAAGTLPPQGRLTIDGRTVRFDDHVGFNFALLTRNGPQAALPAALLAMLESLRVRHVEIVPDRVSTAGQAIDADGTYGRYLDSLHADVALIRPDFVLFGSGRADAIAVLVQQLAQQMGVRAPHAPQAASIAA